MPSKGKILFFVFLILLLAYAACMFLKINNIPLSSIWFSLALLFIGIYAIVYSLFYNLDSMHYLGVILILYSFATVYRFLFDFSFKQYYPMYIACIALASLSVFVKFRQKIHFKLFAIFAFEAILLLSYKANFISFLWLTITNGIFLFFVLFSTIFRARKNLRRKV